MIRVLETYVACQCLLVLGFANEKLKFVGGTAYPFGTVILAEPKDWPPGGIVFSSVIAFGVSAVLGATQAGDMVGVYVFCVGAAAAGDAAIAATTMTLAMTAPRRLIVSERAT
jgi:hypothetical protein